ncbi:hypothetical protein A3A79_01160 [Candidatus Gottesmanbacteria bacterium RIFCSPLOWO2_01_FULL_43_11b]|uniref:Uncharacterized protein n=1 Tax=Candidatus Gottesmanbacteria bacterium RIFCSPLOWO2_01_FULL_43_11b TaxID=1798392 RepID=A0A1F6AGB7_9BACT|nr:MAG: hypothetical protein A3A79_01160 [Candidatus Gottesmanbacteria bacterium RIFCSPLOWO2_01_FULL_43_11b]
MSLFHFWLGSEYQKWREREQQKQYSSPFVSFPILLIAIFVLIVIAIIIRVFFVLFGINLLTV